jgi:hypothetical protein
MCCGKRIVQQHEGKWWETVRVRESIVTFSSETEARRFLGMGTDRLSAQRDLELYRKLNEQREQAGG